MRLEWKWPETVADPGGLGGSPPPPPPPTPEFCSACQFDNSYGPAFTKIMDHGPPLQEFQDPPLYFGLGPDGRVPVGRVPVGRVPDGRVPYGRVPYGRVL